MPISLVPTSWPITIRAPLIAAVLMIIVGTLLSREVLGRLAETQERHLRALTAAYLDGVSFAIMPYVLREDIWEVFEALDRARPRYAGLDAIVTVVVNPANRIIASSDPAKFPTGEPMQSSMVLTSSTQDLIIDAGHERAYAHRVLTLQGQTLGRIYTVLDASRLLNERQLVLWQLVATNAGLIFCMAAVGYLTIRWLVKPVKMLDDYVSRAVDGPIEPIPEAALGPPNSEFGRLFRRYNAMARAASDRHALTERLAEEEKLASIGRLASGMAHEINNPLGGMFNALDAMKRYGDRDAVRATSIRLLESGLRGIQHVVRATLVTYRGEPQDRDLMASDLEDLRYLIQPELRRKNLDLLWDNRMSATLPMPVPAVRQSALNLLLNACAAAPDHTAIRFIAEEADEGLWLTVCDEGPGLRPEYKTYIETGQEPLAALAGGKGLGLWIVRRLIDEAGGAASVHRPPEGGTAIRVYFPAQVKEGCQASAEFLGFSKAAGNT